MTTEARDWSDTRKKSRAKEDTQPLWAEKGKKKMAPSEPTEEASPTDARLQLCETNLQNFEIIGLCYFKLLSLKCLLTEATQNGYLCFSKYRPHLSRALVPVSLVPACTLGWPCPFSPLTVLLPFTLPLSLISTNFLMFSTRTFSYLPKGLFWLSQPRMKAIRICAMCWDSMIDSVQDRVSVRPLESEWLSLNPDSATLSWMSFFFNSLISHFLYFYQSFWSWRFRDAPGWSRLAQWLNRFRTPPVWAIIWIMIRYVSVTKSYLYHVICNLMCLYFCFSINSIVIAW